MIAAQWLVLLQGARRSRLIGSTARCKRSRIVDRCRSTEGSSQRPFASQHIEVACTVVPRQVGGGSESRLILRVHVALGSAQLEGQQRN